MGVVALGSVRSSAVSTLGLALAATWPSGRSVLLVEADPAGGTLSAAAGWSPEPSLVSLAAASRRGLTPALVWEHCQRLPGGVPVLAGPASAAQAHGALGILGDLVGILGTLEADVVVDCGRLDPGSPSVGLFEGAKRPVLVTRPRLSDLHALAAWVESRPAPSATASLVVVGDGGYPDAEIEDALGIEVACRLPWDPRAAAALVSVAASDRQVRLAPLVRAARTLTDRLAAEIAPVPGIAEAAEQPDEPPADRVPAGGSKARVATRVLRAWRPTAAPASANGTGASEVSE